MKRASAAAERPLAARSLAMWLVLLAAMMANGALRVGVLQPRLGEQAARQLASLSGIAVILALSAAFVRRLRSPSSAQLVGVGALWLALTVAFELGFGYVSGLGWKALLADYDLAAGRLWPLVLLATLLAPWLLGRERAGKRADPP